MCSLRLSADEAVSSRKFLSVLPGSPTLQFLRKRLNLMGWSPSRPVGRSLHKWPLPALLRKALPTRKTMTDLDEELAKYRAIPEGWTYRVIRSRRNKDEESETVMQSGILGCSNARAIAEKLQAEYWREHPGKSSWTADLFMIELEHK